LQANEQKITAEINAALEVNKTVGDINAGTIPEGTTIDLTSKTISEPTYSNVVKKIAEPIVPEPNIFKATDNIVENQKKLASKKAEIAVVNEEIKKVQTNETLSKEKRRELIKQRVAEKKAKEKDKEQYEFYEDALDNAEPLTDQVSAKQITDTFYNEEVNKVSPVISMKDLMETSKKKGIEFSVGRDEKFGNITYSMKDKRGEVYTFDELSKANDFLKKHTDDYAEATKAKYEVEKKAMDTKPELVSEVFENDQFTQMAEKLYAKEPRKTIPKDQEPPTNVGEPAKAAKTTEEKVTVTEEDRKLIDRTNPPENETIPQPDFPSYKEAGLQDQRVNTLGLPAKWISVTRTVMANIEKRTPFPAFKHYTLTQDGIRNAEMSNNAYQKRLHLAKKGMNEEASTRIYRALERPALRESNGDYSKFKELIKQDEIDSYNFKSMTREEFNSAKQIRGILEDAAKEYDIPIDRMIQDYAPRIRKEGITWSEGIDKWKLPEEFKWAAQEERTGNLTPRDENIFRVTSAYLRRGSRQKYVGSYLEQMAKEANAMKLDKVDAELVSDYVNTLREVPTGMDAAAINTGEHIADFLNSMINTGKKVATLGYAKEPVKRNMNERFRVSAEGDAYFKVGEKPGFFDTRHFVKNLIDAHLTLSYTGALALRPMAMVRDFYQHILSVPIVGARYSAIGMGKLAPHKIGAAWKEAKAAGALLDDVPIAGGELSMQTNALHSMSSAMVKPNMGAANLARVATYHGFKERVYDAGYKYMERTEGVTDKTALGKEVKRFIDESGIDYFDEALIKNEVMPLLKARDLTSLSERMGVQAAQETQWLYRQGNSPSVMRGTVGRVFGMFGTWPAWAIRYAKNLATHGSIKNRAERIALFAGTNAAMIKAGEEIFGVDISKWILGSPIQWTPMPLQTWQAMANLSSGQDYKKEESMAALKQQAALHIPAYLAAKSVIDARNEWRKEDKLKVALGFKKAKE